MRLLAIDPGNTQSAYVYINTINMEPIAFGKVPNDELADIIVRHLITPEKAVIEMVASYGMAVGADVFETCVWIGRFYEKLYTRSGAEPDLVKRLPVKLHHCKVSNAKDSNIRQALVDRFAPGEPNNGKGTKAAPGWFYGFHADVWAAYALAVYSADTMYSEAVAS